MSYFDEPTGRLTEAEAVELLLDEAAREGITVTVCLDDDEQRRLTGTIRRHPGAQERYVLVEVYSRKPFEIHPDDVAEVIYE